METFVPSLNSCIRERPGVDTYVVVWVLDVLSCPLVSIVLGFSFPAYRLCIRKRLEGDTYDIYWYIGFPLERIWNVPPSAE